MSKPIREWGVVKFLSGTKVNLAATVKKMVMVVRFGA